MNAFFNPGLFPGLFLDYYQELSIYIENIIYGNVVVCGGEVNESRYRIEMQGMRRRVSCGYPEYML